LTGQGERGTEEIEARLRLHLEAERTHRQRQRRAAAKTALLVSAWIVGSTLVSLAPALLRRLVQFGIATVFFVLVLCRGAFGAYDEQGLPKYPSALGPSWDITALALFATLLLLAGQDFFQGEW